MYMYIHVLCTMYTFICLYMHSLYSLKLLSWFSVIIVIIHTFYTCTQDAVSACVTSQFGVNSFEDLSCGSVHKIISESQDSPTVAQTPSISYLYPLLLNGGINLQGPKQGVGVGVLGHQSREDALSCLQRAPLLENLKQWSHWELVYQPQHGPLEAFLQQVLDSQPTSAVHALEVDPGQLIRIDPNSDVPDFINSLSSDCSDPVSTAGHLVSLIVKRGSIQDISPQLLASHVTTCLEKMITSDVSGEEETSVEVAQFIYQVLVRIPLKICQLVASEVSEVLFRGDYDDEIGWLYSYTSVVLGEREGRG